MEALAEKAQLDTAFLSIVDLAKHYEKWGKKSHLFEMTSFLNAF